jgi:hypothetical protein
MDVTTGNLCADIAGSSGDVRRCITHKRRFRSLRSLQRTWPHGVSVARAVMLQLC